MMMIMIMIDQIGRIYDRILNWSKASIDGARELLGVEEHRMMMTNTGARNTSSPENSGSRPPTGITGDDTAI